jgi:hypothetical protein
LPDVRVPDEALDLPALTRKPQSESFAVLKPIKPFKAPKTPKP